MKILTLNRVKENIDGTFGVLLEGDQPFCLTIERQWKDNKPNESCIPKGEYLCKKIQSEHFGFTYEITGVPNRDSVLIHKGNLQTNSHGCVILGEQFGILNDKCAVLSSGDAFTEFTERLKNETEFKLVIV